MAGIRCESTSMSGRSEPSSHKDMASLQELTAPNVAAKQLSG